MESSQPAQDRPALSLDDSFHFICNDNLPCFTRCCRDVSIYLTPYDVLRLRRALQIGSAEVLEHYTRQFLAGDSLIPVVELLMDPGTLRCRLVTDDGCSVYEYRPWACRMYPLDPGSKEGEYRPIVGKDRCLGLGEGEGTVVRDWLAGQGVDSCAEMDRAFQGVLDQGFQGGRRLTSALGKLLFLAYDLDRFAEFLKDEAFRESFDLDDETHRRAQADDELLLLLAFRYIRKQLEDLKGET